jgi:hypothetical protein
LLAGNLPFVFFDLDEFYSLIEMCRDNVEIPSARVMKAFLMNKISEVEESTKQSIPQNRKVSLALDAWTSPNKIAFLAIIAYWIDSKWVSQSQLIGFEHLEERHTGEHIAEKVLYILNQYNIRNRLFAITTDSASNNKTMAESLQTSYEEPEDGDEDENVTLQENLRDATERISTKWNNSQLHIPCFAHVIQLVVNAFIDAIKVTADERSHPIPPKLPEIKRILAMEPSFHRTLAAVGHP